MGRKLFLGFFFFFPSFFQFNGFHCLYPSGTPGWRMESGCAFSPPVFKLLDRISLHFSQRGRDKLSLSSCLIGITAFIQSLRSQVGTPFPHPTSWSWKSDMAAKGHDSHRVLESHRLAIFTYCLGFTAVDGVTGSLEVRSTMWDSSGYVGVDTEWWRTTSLCLYPVDSLDELCVEYRQL